MGGRVKKKRRSKSFKYGRYGYVSDRGLNPKRVTNEDSYLLLEEVPLFAVADGVGGQNAGEVASQIAVEILKHRFANKRLPEDKVKFVEQVIRYANRYLHEMSLDDELLSGMATTLALVLIDKRQAILSHVGDSRIYRFLDGRLYRETRDHTLAHDRLWAAPDIGKVGESVITRALGMDADVEPETKIIAVSPETTFLLCTDGITHHIGDEELAHILASETDPQAICDVLRDLCYERGARDNLTAIVIALDSLWFRLADGRAPFRAMESGGSQSSSPRRQSGESDLADGGGESDREESESRADERRGRFQTEEVPAPASSKTWARWLLGWILVASIVGLGLYVTEQVGRGGFAELLEMPASSPHHVFERGRRLFDAGDFSAARAAFTEAIARAPDRAEYHHWLGRTALAMRDYRAAIASFQKALQLGGRRENYLHLAAAYEAQGDQEKAREALRAYVRGQP
ncbi:MAG: hypothetical protein D6723_18270 [Acidobacteria bacterium]|nr:MAG: hypothetical protein D6723_18270 [Acidobacteriota bacterium]